jgi:23S rRNA (uracil1939-C5)-methyltransferase
VTIERLGQRGEGLAFVGDTRVAVPYALPGETVSIDRDGERATLVGLIQPSPDRIEPICPYFTTCGGCAVQTLAFAPYATWKRGLLVHALERARVTAEVAPLVDAHGAGRRRATFHARTEEDGRTRVGFMQARAHAIVAIDQCPILDPRLGHALRAARGVADALALSKKPLDIVATASESGLDLDLRGHGPLGESERKRLIAVGLAHGLARLANHGAIVVESRRPVMRIGEALVEPPPGTFLQATDVGEATLAEHVTTALGGARRVADLFSGIGTFSLRLAAHAEVAAFDTEGTALAAQDRASRTIGRPVRTETRDLFRRPLGVDELDRYEAIVLDPPRAGAEAQMRAIAASAVETVASVACDVQSFARDAAILLAAGFSVDTIVPIDQFRYSAHLEIFAVFRRAPKRKKRRLLG